MERRRWEGPSVAMPLWCRRFVGMVPHMLGPLLEMGLCCKWQSVASDPPTPSSLRGAPSPFACSGVIHVACAAPGRAAHLPGPTGRARRLGTTLVERALHGRSQQCNTRSATRRRVGCQPWTKCWHSRLPTPSAGFRCADRPALTRDRVVGAGCDRTTAERKAPKKK